MAGQLTIDTLKASSGVLATQNGMTGIAKAWVNWTGGSSPAIQNSFNVSSITRNGTGDFSINFTTTMPNANYVVAGTCQQGLVNYGSMIGFPYQAVATTSAARISTAYNGSTFDANYASVAVFGN